MNVNTGELYGLSQCSENEVKKLLAQRNMEPVPNQLESIANDELKGSKESHVDMKNKNNELVQWADKKRQKKETVNSLASYSLSNKQIKAKVNKKLAKKARKLARN